MQDHETARLSPAYASAVLRRTIQFGASLPDGFREVLVEGVNQVVRMCQDIIEQLRLIHLTNRRYLV